MKYNYAGKRSFGKRGLFSACRLTPTPFERETDTHSHDMHTGQVQQDYSCQSPV